MLVRLKKQYVIISIALLSFLIVYELSDNIRELWFLWKEPVFPVYDTEQYQSLMETKPKEADTNFTAFLDWNPVYKEFKVPITDGMKKRVTLLLIVSTAPRRFDRRKAIRDSWWTECKKKGKVIPECLFFTDKLKPGSEYYQKLQDETKTYTDMRLQGLQGGVEFGTRFMYHMLFAMRNYDFDYFLRVDDDYFLCLDKLLAELPFPVPTRFHWGWVHRAEPVVRPEESMLMLSLDFVIEFLSQDADKIKCTVMADQLVAHWAHEMGLFNIWRHDGRLVHHSMINEAPDYVNAQNICHRLIGIHGSYPQYMKEFWKNRGNKSSYENSGTLLTNSKLVELQPFDWRYLVFKWRHKPKLCIEDPTWRMKDLLRNTFKGNYGGRQEAVD